MPDYQIVIKNNKDKKSRKESCFCSSISDAEKEAKKLLGKGEYVDSIENKSQIYGHYKPVNF